MKKQILFLALLITLSIKSFSQIIFENGYFVNDSNQKIECLIKNIDWLNNPTGFEYKLFQDTIAQTASIETVKEFGINGVSKYIRTTVKIDRSSDEITKMSSERNPEFHEELLFLRVLIEGEASLFLYRDGDLTRFFYKKNDSEIRQLVYKLYLIDDIIGQNNSFRQQLFADLKCQANILNEVKQLKYAERDLVRIFTKYNESTSLSYINYESKQKKDLFNLSFRPGLNYSNLAIRNSSSDAWDTDFDNKFSFRFGIEAEFILPFNKNKWSFIAEPTYQYYKSEKVTETNRFNGGFLVSNVNYQSIELPLGARHYFFINDNSKIFTDLSYIFDFCKNSSIKFTRIDGSLQSSIDIDTRSSISLGFGIGYKYKDKYSLGLRYQTSRDLIGLIDSSVWLSRYRKFSIIFGYSLF